MSITIRNHIVSKFEIETVALRPMIGAFELIFYGTGHLASEQEKKCRAAIVGAEVHAGVSNRNMSLLDMAWPRKPFQFASNRHSQTISSELRLTLMPGRLEALERLRDGSDLQFELKLKGIGSDEQGPEEIYATLNMRVPRSDWVERLRQAGAYASLIIETPIPIGDAGEDWEAVHTALQRAEAAFRGGQYLECVASCRTVLESAYRLEAGSAEFPGWKDLETRPQREDMTKYQREGLIWKAVEHYLHPPHHAPDDGRTLNYTRAEANMALTMTVSLISRLHQS